MHKQRLLLVAGILALVSTLSLAPQLLQRPKAQSPPESLLYPPRLDIVASPGEPLVERSFALQAEADVANVRLSAGPLQEAETSAPTPGTRIAFEPAEIASLTAGSAVTVTLTLLDLPAAGSYASDVAITYDSQPQGTEEGFSLQLSVREAATPASQIELLPQEVILYLEPQAGGSGHVYRGSLRVTAGADAPVTGLHLGDVTALAHTTDPQSYPPILETDVAVDPATAVQLAAGASRTFSIEAPVPAHAGTYAGSLKVQFDGQAGPAVQHQVGLRLIAAEPEIEIEPRGGELQLIPETQGPPYKADFTLHLREGEIKQVRISAQPLDRDGSPGRIFADRISVSPDPAASTITLDAQNPLQTFTVQVAGPATGSYAPGTYRGKLLLYYFGTGTQRPKQNLVMLDLILAIGTPQLSITPADKLLRLVQLQPGEPYKGTFTVRVSEGQLRDIDLAPGSDLGGEDGARIAADQVAVSPDTSSLVLDAGSPPTAFTAAVSPPASGNFEAGIYSSTLLMSYFGGQEVLALRLEARPDATLQWSEAQGNSRERIPLRGTTHGASRRQQYDLTLVETGKFSDAVLTSITVEDLRGREDAALSLPERVLEQVLATAGIPTTQGPEPLPAEVLHPVEGLHGEPAMVRRGTAETFPLRFDFGGGKARPGSYSGFVRIQSENADDVRIPIDITLKHPFWPLPFLVFFVGVLLGTALHTYRSKYRSRDLLLKDIQALGARLDTEVGKGTDFAAFYAAPGKEKLGHADSLLKDKEWVEYLDEAEAWVDAVRSYWVRWSEHSRQLANQQVELEDLLQQVQGHAAYPAPNGSRYLRVRHARLEEIEQTRDSYDTGASMEADVTAERLKLQAFDRAYQREEWAQTALQGLPGGFPPALLGSLGERLQEQRDTLAATEDDAAVATAATALETLGADLRRVGALYDKAKEALTRLKDQLLLDEVRSELQADERRAFDERLAKQEATLSAAASDADLTAVAQAAADMRDELQGLYERNRLFYYRQPGAMAGTENWIADLQGEHYLGWPNVAARLEQMGGQAASYVDSQQNYEQASNLMYYRWCIAWFYHTAVAEVYRLFSSTLPQEVEAVLRGAVTWILTENHMVSDREAFDQALLGGHLETLYRAAAEALAPAFVESPAPPVAPQPPSYRPLPLVKERGKGPAPTSIGDFHFVAAFAQVAAALTGTGGTIPTGGLSPREYLLGMVGGIIDFFRWLLGDPGTRLFLFGLGVQVVTFLALLVLGYTNWKDGATFGSTPLDYFNLFFIGFAGTSTSNTVLEILKGWGAKVPASGE